MSISGQGKRLEMVVGQKANNTKKGTKKEGEEGNYEGKFPKNTHVLAINRNKQWEIAKVITCKYFTLPDGEQVLKYYVTYLDYDKRMDRWLTEEMIALEPLKVDQELERIEAEKKAKEEDKFLPINNPPEKEGEDQNYE